MTRTNDHPSSMSASSRIFGLDLVRAVAIIFVVLSHGSFLLKGTDLEGFPYFPLIDGVDLFFVLSGYLIGSILLKSLEGSERFGIRGLVHFWKRRWFRTLPNYYLILIANILVVKYGIINEDIQQFNFHFFTFTQNFWSPFHSFFWESWSLSVEEWFYLISPVAIALLCKALTVKRAFLLVTVAMIVLPLSYRFSNFDANIDYFWWDVTFRKTVACRLDSIGYGLLLAWLHRYTPEFWKKCKWPALFFAFAMFVFVLNYQTAPSSLYRQTIYFSLIPIAVMGLIPLAASWKSSKSIIAKAITHISKISYSMYLINLSLVALVIRDNCPPTGNLDGILKYIAYWLVVILVSSLLYRYFERPVMNFRDRF